MAKNLDKEGFISITDKHLSLLEAGVGLSTLLLGAIAPWEPCKKVFYYTGAGCFVIAGINYLHYKIDDYLENKKKKPYKIDIRNL